MNTQSQITPERIQLHLRSRFNPIRNLTPPLLASYLDSWDAGYIGQFALAAETIERRDDLLKTVVPKRKQAPTRHGWEVLTVDDSRAAKRQQEALTFLYNHLTAAHAVNQHQRGGVKMLLRQMQDSVGKEFAVHELVWKPLGKGQLTVECRFVPLWFFENTKGELRFLETEGAIDGTPLEEGGWMVTTGEGLMVASAICYMFKRLPLQDWLAFSEKFGLPGVLGKTDAAPGSEEWEAMKDAVKVFANEFASVCNRSNEITLVETARGGSSNLPMPGLVEAMNRSMATLWRGNDLGTISKDGQAVGSNPQESETDLLDQGDCENLEETLAEFISRPALRYLFGPDTEPMAYLKVLTTKRQNVAQDIQVDTFLRDSGAPLALKDTMERYGRALPEAGEALLTKPAAPAPADPQADGDFANAVAPETQALVLQSIAQDFAPLVARLKAIEAIEAADVQQAKLRELLADWDRLTRSLTADPTAARALEQASATALFSGLATRVQGAELGNANENHDEAGKFASGSGGGSGADAGAAKQKVRDFLDKKGDEVAYAKVAPAVAAKIKSATGQDVSGYHHLIDRDALTHINRQHGVGKEDQAGHLPVTRDDIERIPEIVSSPDSVSNGGKSARGRSTVKYAKRFAGTTYYIEEVWTHDRVLAAKTMWKESAPGNSATPRGGGSHTSETFGAGGNKA